MTQNTDYILGELQKLTESSNDTLGEMKKLLIQIAKQGSKGSGGTSSGSTKSSSSGNTSGAGSKKILNDLFGEMKGFGKFALGNNTTAPNALRALGTSAGVISKSFMALGGPIGIVAQTFGLVIDAGVKLYEYMNDQLELYQQINSAGITLNQGIVGLRKGSINALMSVEQFSTVIKSNSDAMAMLEGVYGDGVVHFGELVQKIQLAQNSLGLYGLSQQQVADITAKNLKIQKMYLSNANFREMDEAKSTKKFIGDLTYMSKVMGTSVDELVKKVTSIMSTAKVGSMKTYLKNFAGLPEEVAANVTQAITTSFEGFSAGPELFNAFTTFMQNNSITDDYTSSAAEISQLFSEFKSLAERGVTDVTKYNKILKERGASDAFISQMEQRIQILSQTGDAAQMAQAEALQKILNAAKMMNDPKNNPTPVFEQLTTRFNNWLSSSIVKPFEMFQNNLLESVSTYLTNVLNSTDTGFGFISKVATDAVSHISDAFVGLFDYALYVPKQILGLIGGDQWADKIMNSFKDLFSTILQIPSKILSFVGSMFFGTEEETKSKAQELKGALGNLVTSVTGMFSMDNFQFSTDDIKNKLTTAFESMKDKFTGWWDRAKGWFSDDVETKSETKKPEVKTISTNTQKTKTVAPVTAKPESTAPVKVENKQTNSQPLPPDSQAMIGDIRDMLGSLNRVASNTESVNVILSQVATLLRQISENTEQGKNT